MTNDPVTARDFEELRRNDKWTTGKLIGLALVTLGAALTFLFVVSP